MAGACRQILGLCLAQTAKQNCLRPHNRHTDSIRTTSFKKFCKNNNINHKLASAHSPESNGLAEAAVKNMKSFVIQTAKEKQNLSTALAAWQNMARHDGISPSQLFCDRLPKQSLPMPIDPTPKSISNKGRGQFHATSIASRKAHTKDYEIFSLGTRVIV